MRISDLLYETWQALMANKGRSLLTILGIVIGISAVIAMTSLIGGVRQSLVKELGLDQSRVMYISIMRNDGSSASTEDIETIRQNVDGYEFITGVQYGSSKASSETKQADAMVMGADKGFFQAMGLSLVEGRLLTDEELSGDAMVVVIDATLKKSLFGSDESALGANIQLGNDTYAVAGVVESSDALAATGQAYMPLQTCALRITGSTTTDMIMGYAVEGTDMKDLAQRTEAFIRQQFNISQEDETEGWGWVNVESTQSIQEQLESMLMAFQLMMTAVASISLLVGGIGIMNMMLTNVTERMREIGLRKALGAHKADITAQFLMESVAICLVGGVIGLVLGYFAAFGLAAISGGMMSAGLGTGSAITPVIDLPTVLMAVGICVGIGIVFGFWPARRAAKLDAVESLRYQ